MVSSATATLDVIARRLTFGETVATASLIAPDLALTPNHVVANVTEVELSSPLSSLGTVRAEVVARDVTRDTAVLRLSAPVPDLPDVLAASDPPPQSHWESLTFAVEPGPRENARQFKQGPAPGFTALPIRLAGTVVGSATVDRIQHLHLRPDSGAPDAGWSGAPVLVDGRLVGIMARRQESDLFAIPIASLAGSQPLSMVADLLPLDDAEFFGSLSPSSRTALAVAASLITVTGQDQIHMEHLILGLYAKKDGPTQRLIDGIGLGFEGLRSALGEAIEFNIPSLPSTSTPGLTALPAASGHAREAFRAARNVARAHGSLTIQSRHLIHGALSIEQCTVVKKLIERGVRKEQISLTDRAAGAKAFAIAGYRSDEVGGKDLLNIDKEVESLCMVLAAKDVEPPLSLGLFGDWGSGKSFFMSAMETWFKDLAEELSKGTNKDSPYCSHIVQLKFNAWHYSDTNLWATLTSAILQGLADALAQKDDAASHYKRAELQNRKVQAQENLDRAEHEAGLIEAEVRAVDEKLEKVAVEASPALVVRESLRAGADQPALKDKLRGAMTQLGIPQLQAAGADLQAQLLEVRGLWDALAITVRHSRSRRLFAYAALAVFAIVLGVPLLFWAAGQGLTEIVASATAVFSATAVGLRQFVAPIRSALGTIDEVRGGAQAALERQLQKERADLALGADAARQEAAAARREIADVDQQLEELRPDRQMANFIRQRAQSSDYIGQLGTISHARKDFEQLTILLTRVKELGEQPGDNKEAPILPRIDRIILYIDDLDRCPEDKVVHVLQAVHLLLAFKLFVVVVGVDPRWLLHSLKQHSTAFQNGDDSEAETSNDERTHWRSTPLNYLEKIFQIPFTLRPMGEAGFGQLVNHLTEPVEKRPEPRLADTPQPPSPGGGPPETPPAKAHPVQTPPAGSTPPAPQTPPPAPPPNAAGTSGQPATQPPTTATQAGSGAPTPRPSGPKVRMDPAVLRIEDFEIACMKQLHDLIPSPRAAKRFVNVYRLLRTSVADDQWEAFIGNEQRGGYRPVLVMLAMLMGYPTEATEMLRAIIEGRLPTDQGPVDRTFNDLIREFETSVATGANLEGDRWPELIRKLMGVATLVPDDYTCSDLRSYASTVARYSFQSGRALLM